MKEVYLLATERNRALRVTSVKGAFESDEVEVITGEKGLLFSLRAESVHIEVKFESRKRALGLAPEVITGTDACRKALSAARGFYRIAFELGDPQASVAVFEALWCARTLLERVPGVLLDLTSFKLHDAEDVAEITELDFDIRDHINLHAVEVAQSDTPMWVHSHGMEKFGARDIEVFHLGEADLKAAETFFHELCTDLAFGQGPKVRAPVETSGGHTFQLIPSEEARLSLFGVDQALFAGHEAGFWTVVAEQTRHSISELLRPYRERFKAESAEESAALARQAQELLPAFKSRFLRKGWMEPLGFLVRAPFETHPENARVAENLWLEVLTWEGAAIVGKLTDGSQQTTEWRKGARVEVAENQVNATALAREGRALDENEMRELLVAERPM